MGGTPSNRYNIYTEPGEEQPFRNSLNSELNLGLVIWKNVDWWLLGEKHPFTRKPQDTNVTQNSWSWKDCFTTTPLLGFYTLGNSFHIIVCWRVTWNLINDTKAETTHFYDYSLQMCMTASPIITALRNQNSSFFTQKMSECLGFSV